MSRKHAKDKIDLSVVMPCLNEEMTIGGCIDEVNDFLLGAGLKGEIIVVDNNCTDDSPKIAKEKGAVVVKETQPGYGSALRAGLKAAQGERIIMGDCDLTYNFAKLGDMYDRLALCDVVIGDRFKGGIAHRAMPLSHHIGVRGLSWVARKKYKTDVYDFHCGLRGIRKDSLAMMDYKTTGMEFATEMIAEAKRKGATIGQVPVELRRGVKGRKPKLRTVRDGFRHLRYILHDGTN